MNDLLSRLNSVLDAMPSTTFVNQYFSGNTISGEIIASSITTLVGNGHTDTRSPIGYFDVLDDIEGVGGHPKRIRVHLAGFITDETVSKDREDTSRVNERLMLYSTLLAGNQATFKPENIGSYTLEEFQLFAKNCIGVNVDVRVEDTGKLISGKDAGKEYSNISIHPVTSDDGKFLRHGDPIDPEAEAADKPVEAATEEVVAF